MCLGTAFVCGEIETGGAFFESVGPLLVTKTEAGNRPLNEARNERNALTEVSEKRPRFRTRPFHFFRPPCRPGGGHVAVEQLPAFTGECVCSMCAWACVRRMYDI